ncbi:hypothetical protein [Sphingobacterium paludis]|nr:hypothetical protein [Sphingobacterium paludis]
MYSYDNLNRLLSGAGSERAVMAETFSYEDMGNIRVDLPVFQTKLKVSN